MGTYAVTGSASGMGHAAAEKLRTAGHTVIGVDLRDAEVIADLSTDAGRRTAAAGVVEVAGGRLDGAVLAAGIGPTPGPGRARLILEVNYFGVIDLLQAWRPLLAAAGHAKVVVVASNSATTMPAVPNRSVRALLAGDADKAVRALRMFGKAAPSRSAGTEIRNTWPNGWCSCSPTPPISSAAASFSLMAALTPISEPTTGRSGCPIRGWRATCGGWPGSASPVRTCSETPARCSQRPPWPRSSPSARSWGIHAVPRSELSASGSAPYPED